MTVSPEDGYNRIYVSSVGAESGHLADHPLPVADRFGDPLLLYLGLGGHDGSNQDGTIALLFAVTL